jgi:hypothetical protein
MFMGVDICAARGGESAKHDHEQGWQVPFEPTQKQAAIIADGGKHSVDVVVGAAFEVVAGYTVPELEAEAPNQGLDERKGRQ